MEKLWATEASLVSFDILSQLGEVLIRWLCGVETVIDAVIILSSKK
jgi:hypothetical protein